MNLKGNKFIYQVSEYKTPINKNYLNLFLINILIIMKKRQMN